MKQTPAKTLKGLLRYWPSRWTDRRLNRRFAVAEQRFLVVRHSAEKPYRFRFLLDWLEREFPSIRQRFELRLLPCRIRDFSPYVLHAPWLQDPVFEWSPRAYRQAMELAEHCEAMGVPVINRVDRTAHSIKSECTRRMASVGVRTPRITPIKCLREFRDTLGGLEFPLLIREDRGHGWPSYLVESRAELDRTPVHRFAHPIASEFIDVRSPDGLYRKYRFLATGSQGVTRHLMIGDHWEVRPDNRVRTPEARAEEIRFLSAPDPNFEILQQARRALEFDLAAFDYSYDRQGRLVVWEANPFPDMDYPSHPDQGHIHPYVERSFASLASLYLRRAGLPAPSKLIDMLAGQSPTSARQAA